MNKLKLIKASVLSAIVTSIFVVVITIWADLNAPLKDWLKSVSGHHWTTKSIFSVLIFVLFIAVWYLLIKKADAGSVARAIKWLIFVVVAGVLAISFFYTAHHFGLI